MVDTADSITQVAHAGGVVAPDRVVLVDADVQVQAVMHQQQARWRRGVALMAEELRRLCQRRWWRRS